MRDLFKGFYRLSDEEFDLLWKNAIFIFDTNVLLNLYRYQSSASTNFLEVLKKVSDRVWIPHQVGLEFHRNRLVVIADQHNKFSEVKNLVNSAIDQMKEKLDHLQLKTRHSHINPDQLLEEIGRAKEGYFRKLQDLEKDSINPSSQDKILESIESLFRQKVGPPPANQEEMDRIYTEGESRFSNSIPPGYKDVSKEEATFVHSGIEYKKKYGDLIIWKQIIKHVSLNSIKDVIFVTDDSKNDWWLSIKGKTIGGRPELTNEIIVQGGVERFHIYSTQSFLEYLQTYFKIRVTSDTIDEVKNVVEEARRPNLSLQNIHRLTEHAVFKWLKRRYVAVERGREFPDFFAVQNGERIGIETKFVYSPTLVVRKFRDTIVRFLMVAKKYEVRNFTIVFVSFEESKVLMNKSLGELILRYKSELDPQGELKITLLFGNLKLNELSGVARFREVAEFCVEGDVLRMTYSE